MVAREPHIHTPAHDYVRVHEPKVSISCAFPLMTRPASDEPERNRLAEMRLLLQRTLEWLRGSHG